MAGFTAATLLAGWSYPFAKDGPRALFLIPFALAGSTFILSFWVFIAGASRVLGDRRWLTVALICVAAFWGYVGLAERQSRTARARAVRTSGEATTGPHR